MIEDIVKDYAEYFKLDLTTNFQTIQDVIDNMITRLEELTSVLQMIKVKNNDCCSTVTNDISAYRNEITVLAKKVITLSEVICKLQANLDILEKKVEKGESDFGINNDNKLKILFRPFLKRKDVSPTETQSAAVESLTISSVTDYFKTSS